MLDESHQHFKKETSPRIGNISDGDQNTILEDRLTQAELMLAHAAEAGIDVNTETIDRLQAAQIAFASKNWTADAARQFWQAYSNLCFLIKPVTGESLKACAGTDLPRSLNRYRRGTLWLALFILPLSILMFVNTSITNEINDR